MSQKVRKLVSGLAGRIDRNALIASTAFCLFMVFFERTVLRVNYRSYLSYFLANKPVFIFYVAMVTVSLLCVLVYLYISFLSSWKYKVIYFLVFSVAVLFEYGYRNAFGRFSYYTDLQVAASTTAEQKLNAAIAYLNWMGIIPCVLYAALLIVLKRKVAPHGIKSLIAVGILFIAFFTGYWYAGAAKFSVFYNYPTVSLSTFSRTVTSYTLFRAFYRPARREKIGSPQLPGTSLPNNNIVLIVDESVRSDHLSLNGYQRPTTPFLDQLAQQGLIHNWGMAVSGSTCSLISHNLLVTGLVGEEPSNDNQSTTAPLIFQYARAMGYKTHYFDGQMDTVWGEMEDEGLTYLDSWLGAAHFRTNIQRNWEIDFEIARAVNQIISSSHGNFIFVFKRGAHIPYNLSFPAEEKTWAPSFTGMPINLAPEQLPAVANAYDNAIKYNSDRFFRALAADYQRLPNNTVFIYTSDHGQTLGENGARHSHCRDTKPEAMVPLFMIGNIGKDVDVNFKAAHANLFATMLDLMAYPESLRRHRYAISLLKAKATDSQPRYFVSSDRPEIIWVAGRLIKFD